MRRILLTLLAGAVLITASTQASAHEWKTWRLEQCRFSRGDGWSRWELRQLVGCATGRWAVPGGRAKAFAVISCESGWYPRAYNPGGYAGLFQQSIRYWRGRWEQWGRAPIATPPDVFHPRSNVIVSVRMAHRYGWGPWSCA